MLSSKNPERESFCIFLWTLMYLCLVVILDDCLISEGKTDDYGLITIADFNIS